MELILQPLSTTTQQSYLTARYIFKLLPYQKDKHMSNQRKNEACVYFFSNYIWPPKIQHNQIYVEHVRIQQKKSWEVTEWKAAYEGWNNLLWKM